MITHTHTLSSHILCVAARAPTSTSTQVRKEKKRKGGGGIWAGWDLKGREKRLWRTKTWRENKAGRRRNRSNPHRAAPGLAAAKKGRAERGRRGWRGRGGEGVRGDWWGATKGKRWEQSWEKRAAARTEGGAGVTCGARRYSKLTGVKGFRAAARWLITRAAKHNIKKQTSPASADPGSRRSNRPGANQPDAHKHSRAENFVFDGDLCCRYDLIRLWSPTEVDLVSFNTRNIKVSGLFCCLNLKLNKTESHKRESFTYLKAVAKFEESQ